MSGVEYDLRWPRDEIADVEGDLHEDNPDFTPERLLVAVARIVAAAELEALARVLDSIDGEAAGIARARGRYVYPLHMRLEEL